MSYENDVAYNLELERALSAADVRGGCTCVPRRSGIFHTNCCMGDNCDTPHTPPPDYCEVCGGAMVIFEILYIDNWRGAAGSDELG